MTYRYTGDGQLHSVRDSKTGYTYTYTYDSLGRLIASIVKNSSGAKLMQTRQEYNANNQLTAQHWTVGSTTYSETYTYSKTEGTLSGYNNALGESITLNYDSLRRLSSVNGGKYTRTYTYRDVSTTNTTSQVSSLTYSGLSNAPSFGYSYDVLGNIATYNQNGTTYTYSYDAQNQLLSQTGGGKTYSYTYDAAGNILTASDGTTSHSYTYGHAAWKDLLTAFDGQTISYDTSGNPTSYYNGTRWTMTWQEGRRLMSASDGTTDMTFSYDSEGLRLGRTAGTTVYDYTYAGGKLIRQDIHRSGTHTDRLDFIYDHAGHPYALKHTTGGVTTTYYYIINLQGDVLSLVNASGTPVATYTYDPYGKPLTATGTLANINPLRYRGYVYDPETGLYYLQSRYYDPSIGRFINADAFVSTGQGLLGNNMFAYCRNNPVSRIDLSGTEDVDVVDLDGNPLTDDDEIAGGGGGGGSGTSGTTIGAVGNGGQGPKTLTIVKGANGIASVPNPNNEPTDVHHIVEQCQAQKSGFARVNIQGSKNLITIPRSLHHKISGYYSSKPVGYDQRFRNSLAGKTFESQWQTGMDILESFWSDLYG